MIKNFYFLNLNFKILFMDKTDEEIIRMIYNKLSKKEIAKKLKLTEVAIRKRIKKLEKNKILLGFKPILNYKKVNFVVSLTGIDVEPEYLLNVLEDLKNFKEIKSIYLTNGDHMILVEIFSENMEKLKEMQDKILKMHGVKRVCPAILIDVVR